MTGSFLSPHQQKKNINKIFHKNPSECFNDLPSTAAEKGTANLRYARRDPEPRKASIGLQLTCYWQTEEEYTETYSNVT